MSDSTAIRITNLEKSYDAGDTRTHALRGIDLDIESGEFVAVIGSSGAGKTTLLNVLGGLDRDYDGRVRVGERTLGELNDTEMAALRNDAFGFVFQHFNLLDHLSVAENVELPGFFGPAGDVPEGRADELLRSVGLADRADDAPKSLSGGQRQRVAIARALYGDPSLLFCDEPTGNLDRQTGLDILELFADLNREEGRTLLIVTHESHVAGMARRIVRIEDGRIADDRSNEPSRPERSSLVDTDGAVAS